MSTEDEFLIHKLVARYADAVNRRDEKAWAATWAEKAVWQLPTQPETRGRESIVELWAGAMKTLPFVVQLVHHGVVHVNGDLATGTWYLNEHMKFSEGAGVLNIGCYKDQYTRASGEWLFAERRYTILYNDADASEEINLDTR